MDDRHYFGVWLDHRKPQVIELHGDDVRQRQIDSTVERHTHATGGTQLGGRAYISAMGASERRLGERREHEINLFYASIAQAIAGADEIAILGSGVARGEFTRYLGGDARVGGRVVSTGPSKEVTPPQLVARFKKIFHRDPPRRSASKRTAK